MNRSIQSEGAFGVIKQDYGFRQFLLRGNKKGFGRDSFGGNGLQHQQITQQDSTKSHRQTIV